MKPFPGNSFHVPLPATDPQLPVNPYQQWSEDYYAVPYCDTGVAGEVTRWNMLHMSEEFRASNHPHKIFVGGIPMAATAEDVFALFEAEIGPVCHVQLVLAPIECDISGRVIQASITRHRGYGFVVFARPHLKEKCLSRSRYYLHDKMMEVKEMTRFMKPKSEITSSMMIYKLFVALKSDSPKDRKSIVQLSESELKAYFEQFGKVGAVSIARDSVTRKIKTYGFISFLQADGPSKALAHGREHCIQTGTSEYKIECKPYRPGSGAPQQPFLPVSAMPPNLLGMDSFSSMTSTSIANASGNPLLLPPGAHPFDHVLALNETRPPQPFFLGRYE